MHESEAKGIPWLYSADTWQIALISLAAGIFVFAAAFALQFWLLRQGSSALEMVLISDVVAGLLSAALQFSTIQYGRYRRTLVMRRLEVIGEMNHHVRNALDSITSAAVLGGLDREHLDIIENASKRITWALTDILGKRLEA